MQIVRKNDRSADFELSGRFYLVVVLLLLFAFALRVHQLDAFSLWFDEASTARNLEIPFRQVLEEKHSLGHVPYYLFLRLWPKLESSEFSLRYPSVLFGVLGVAGTFVVGRRLFGVKAGILASLYLSLSPMHVWYSREARTYACTLAMSVFAAAALLNLLQKRDKKTWAGLIVGQVLVLYAHLFAGLTNVWQTVVFFFSSIQKRSIRLLWRWVASQVVVVILASPMILIMVWGVLEREQVPWIVPPAGTIPLELSMHLSGVRYLGQRSWWMVIWVVWLVLLLWGIIKARPLSMPVWKSLLFLSSWAFIPPAILIGVSWTWKPIYLHRYVHHVLPAYVLLIGSGIAETFRNQLVILSGVILIFGQMFAVYDMLNNPFYAQPDWRTAQSFLSDSIEDNDLVLFHPWLLKRSFDYYNLKQETIPESKLDTVGQMQGLVVVSEDVVTQKLIQIENQAASKTMRLWLVERWSEEASNQLHGREGWTQTNLYEFNGGIQVFLFAYRAEQ